MKKKLAFLIILIILFTLTGCGNKEDNDGKISKTDGIFVTIDGEKFKLNGTGHLEKLYYPENYVDFNTDAMGRMRTMRYRKNDETIFEVRITCEKESSFEDNLKQIKFNTIDRKINNINYKYFTYVNDDGTKAHVYMTYYGKVTYSIMFITIKDLPDLEKVFMNNVYFK